MIKTMQHYKNDGSHYLCQYQFDKFILPRPGRDLEDRRRHCNEQPIE